MMNYLTSKTVQDESDEPITNSNHPIIRVMVADDQPVVCQGFTVFIKACDDMALVGEARNGQEAIQVCSQLRPDVVLMDMRMPIVDGVEATRRIRKLCPDTQVIALTSFTEEEQYVLDALDAGVIAYLFKDITAETLAQTIRAAYRGEHTIPPQVARMLIHARKQRDAHDYRLSERELEVLALMVQGLMNKEIADRLDISTYTAKYHVSSILGKLGANSRTEAVTIAHQHKLVSET